MSGRPTEGAMWASVASTLRDTVLGSIHDEYTRLATIALIGVADYAATRGADPGPDRRARLESALEALNANPLVAAAGSGTAAERAAAVLVGAVGRDDPAAAEVRTVIRTLLVRQLDEDLDATSGMGEAFRGRLPTRDPA
ncbi:MAG: hypothetical protein KGQ66_07495 [Acidobacteriota bacterium]|nr:hypothetical protein [Acidobacteriota bacterium]